MKILVVCQHYYPEPFRITDICEELVKRGHEVTVITGTPNYPEGVIYKGYEKGKKKREVLNGVEILRVYEIPRKKGILFRFLNYYSFAISSKRLAKKLKGDYDVVFANQLSPIMMVDGAIAYKKKYNKKLIMYVMDLWPESLIVGGVKRNSLIYKYYHKVSLKKYRSADKLMVTSKLFDNYLKSEFGINENIIEYLPQYAEDLFSAKDCIKEPSNKTEFLFAGNIGKLQSVQTIVRAAQLLKDREDIQFHIVGDGVSLDECKLLAKGLNNIVFYGRLPLEEMPNLYKKADCMLVPMINDEVISSVLPGKVQSYMASGKPIIGSIGGEAKIVISEANCGYCGRAEDFEELKDNVVKFVNSKNKIEFGINSLSYYKKHFTKEQFFEKLENELKGR